MATTPATDPFAEIKAKYTALGLENVGRFVAKNKFDETAAKKAVVSEVYKLDPAKYTEKKNFYFDRATNDYQFNKVKLTAPTTKPSNFVEAAGQYQALLRQAITVGAGNLNETDVATLGAAAKSVRDFDSKDLGAGAQQIIKNIGLVSDALKGISKQRALVEDIRARIKDPGAYGLDKRAIPNEKGKLITETDALNNLIRTASLEAPDIEESLSRFGVTDLVAGVGKQDKRVGTVDTGLANLGADKIFGKSSLVGKLNSQVTDDQIRTDLSNTRRTQAQSVFQMGNEALVDLNSQLAQANSFKATLSEGDTRLKSTQETIDRLTKDIADVTADTMAAKAIADNPGDFGQETISAFREALRLPEERALDQIGEIDPAMLANSRALSDQFRNMAASPLGPTQDDRTEQLRGMIEDEALNQLRLGSTLDESTRREVQQAVRGAQAARGNVFGVGPATEEAMQTGLMGEQRRNQRYGAAAAFLGSGMSRGDQAARNTTLRQSLDLSRLGAANEFMASGANPYNLASQRVANQNANFLNYINANTAATGGFANTAAQIQPYQFINPNAGFLGAQNAANIYGNLLDFTSRNFASQASAQAQLGAANSVPNYLSAFSSLVPSFSFGR